MATENKTSKVAESFAREMEVISTTYGGEDKSYTITTNEVRAILSKYTQMEMIHRLNSTPIPPVPDGHDPADWYSQQAIQRIRRSREALSFDPL